MTTLKSLFAKKMTEEFLQLGNYNTQQKQQAHQLTSDTGK